MARTYEKINDEEIIAVLENYLPRFKIPDRFYRWPDSFGQTGLKPSRQYFVEYAEKISKKRDP